MKAIITQATDVDANGQQSVSFNIVEEDGKVLVDNIWDNRATTVVYS